jgi:hypothetical protein
MLMLQYVIGSLLKALGITGSKQRVEQNVVGLERGIGFQFTAPIPLRVLLRKKESAGPIHGGSHAAREIVNFAETQLRSGRSREQGGGVFVHISLVSLRLQV